MSSFFIISNYGEFGRMATRNIDKFGSRMRSDVCVYERLDERERQRLEDGGYYRWVTLRTYQVGREGQDAWILPRKRRRRTLEAFLA
jgi:hypothetical protein